MKKIFLMAGENVNLGLAEIEALGGSGDCIDRVCVASGCKEHKRLAFVQNVSKFLFSCKVEEIKDHKIFLWGSYRVRIVYGDRKKERKIANEIWKCIINPKVDLKNAKNQIDIYVFKDKIFVGKQIWKNDNSFLERQPHKKPAFYPTSIIPKLAKACVNLTGLKKGKILDPFCGVGSILVEAGLMKFKVLGYDRDMDMILKSDQNLEHYGIKKYKLVKRDSTIIDKKEFDAIVTDVPYSRLVEVKGIGKLYDKFFSNIVNLVKHEKLVVIVPDNLNVEKLKRWFRIERNIPYIVHRSLTRKILVLRR